VPVAVGSRTALRGMKAEDPPLLLILAIPVILMCLCMYVCMCVCVCMCVSMYVCVCVCVRKVHEVYLEFKYLANGNNSIGVLLYDKWVIRGV
jgi:hypothetical protein